MPTYDFRCTECETETERHVSISEISFRLTLPCETCGKDTLQKQVIKGKKPVHFKGNKWADKGGL